MNTTSIFLDEKLQQTFNEQGYVVVPLLSAAEIKELEGIYQQFSSEANTGFHTTLNLDSYDLRREIFESVAAMFFRHLPDYITGFKPYIGSFAVKASGTSGNIPLHLDWSAVDEQKHISLNVWVPLTDVDEQNGCLGFLKGSHKFEFTMRGSNITFIAAYTKFENDDILGTMYRQYPLQLVPMKMGEAVIYDQRLAHFSHPNQLAGPRLAGSLMCIPEDATPIHYHRKPNGDVDILEAPTDFYLNYTFNSTPSSLKQIGTIKASEIKSVQDQTRVNVVLPTVEPVKETVEPQPKTNFFQRIFFGKK